MRRGRCPKSGRGGRPPHPVSTSKAKSPRRCLRLGGDVADVQVPCTRYSHRRPLARARFRWRPPQWAGLVGLRPGLLRQVVPKRAVLDAGGSRLYVTKGGSPTRHQDSLWSIHATPQARGRKLRQEAFSLVVGGLALPASGRKPVKPSRGDTESAISPFGSGRPVRPWLVVNPGEGTATPWASWPQPSSENNFPAAARLPRGTNSFRFQVLHVVATAARCGQPIPRRPDHNKDALARPCSTRKEKHHG